MTAETVLRVLYLSPVVGDGSEHLYATMAEEVRQPGTEVHYCTLPEGDGRFTHIEYRTYEALVTRGILRAVRQASKEGFDAFVIGCFYDTALHDARELSGEMIVTGPCLASCEIANSLANRFGIIVGRQKWVAQMEATVRGYGYGDRLAGFYPVDMGVNEFQCDHDVTAERLLAAGRKAVEEDHAEALILGCTAEIGFHEVLQRELGVPVIDPSTAALKHAEYMAGLKRTCNWLPSRKYSCEAPPEEELALIGCFKDESDAFGTRVIAGPDMEGQTE
jgi:Hydantoin racemase